MPQNCLTAMHTPAVLTFLHLLAAALLHLVLVWWGVLPAPQLSAAAAKGASLPAAIAALQVSCRMAGLRLQCFPSLCILLLCGG